MILISRYLINTFTVLALSTYFTYGFIQLSKLCRLYKNKTRQENKMKIPFITISWGELFSEITILQIKLENPKAKIF